MALKFNNKRPKFLKAKTYRQYLKEKIETDPSYAIFRKVKPPSKDDIKYA